MLDEEGNGIYEWSACEGEDEVIANKFADLHISTKGDIVQIVNDNSLTIGIVVDYCHDGFYDMWVWNKNQENEYQYQESYTGFISQMRLKSPMKKSEKNLKRNCYDRKEYNM